MLDSVVGSSVSMSVTVVSAPDASLPSLPSLELPVSKNQCLVTLVDPKALPNLVAMVQPAAHDPILLATLLLGRRFGTVVAITFIWLGR